MSHDHEHGHEHDHSHAHDETESIADVTPRPVDLSIPDAPR